MALNKSIAFIILLIVCISNSYALSFSYQQLENNTLELSKGTQTSFPITIENSDSEEYNVNISVHSQIATVEGDTLVAILPKSNNTITNILITIPDNVSENNTYPIEFTAIPLEKNTTELQAGFNLVYNKEFTVKIISPVITNQSIDNNNNGSEKYKSDQIVNDQKNNQEDIFDSIAVTITLLIIISALIFLIWRRTKNYSKIKPTTNNTSDQKNNNEENSKKIINNIENKPLPTTQITPYTNEPEKEKVPTSTTHATKIELPKIQDKESEIMNKIVPAEYFKIPIEEQQRNTPLEQKSEITEDQAVQSVLAKQMPKESRALKFAEEIENTFGNNKKTTYNNDIKYPKATGSERFYMHNGVVLEDLGQLRDILITMSDDQFYEHVNSTKHDFAAWTEGIFAMHELAAQMRKATTRTALHEVLVHEI